MTSEAAPLSMFHKVAPHLLHQLAVHEAVSLAGGTQARKPIRSARTW